MTETTHILIAEDNPGDVRLIKMALAETADWNVELAVARDGAQAIAMLEASVAEGDQSARRPDLVILDFNLPKRSGTGAESDSPGGGAQFLSRIFFAGADEGRTRGGHLLHDQAGGFR